MRRKEVRKVYSIRKTGNPVISKNDITNAEILSRINKLRKRIMNNAEIYEILTYYKILSQDMGVFLEKKLNDPEVLEVKKEISSLKEVKYENSLLKSQVKDLELRNENLDSTVNFLDGIVTNLNAKIEKYENKFKVVDLIGDKIWKIIQEKDGSWTVKTKNDETSNRKTLLEAISSIG